MTATYIEESRDRVGPFKFGSNAANAVRCSNKVDFVYSWEESFAAVLDEHEIAWQYKPRTFAVEWDEEGNFVDSFSPDFYLPVRDVYVELAPDSSASHAKARKVRLLRKEYPEIRIELISGTLPFSDIRETLF